MLDAPLVNAARPSLLPPASHPLQCIAPATAPAALALMLRLLFCLKLHLLLVPEAVSVVAPEAVHAVASAVALAANSSAAPFGMFPTLLTAVGVVAAAAARARADLATF